MVERRGKDRCDEGQFCPLHDHLESERKEYREMVCSKLKSKADSDLNKSEHEEMQNGISVALKKLDEIPQSYTPWKVFALLMAILVPLLGWISISHFALTNRMTRTETIMELALNNQLKMMRALNIEPETSGKK